MRTLTFAALAAVMTAPLHGAGPKLTGGTGTIYLGSYAKRMVVIDEATEQVTAEIPLTTGIPWNVHLTPDRTRFYIENADQEHLEVVDLAARKSVDAFTLSEGNKRVRVMAFAVDPRQQVMTLVTRTATKLSDRFEIGSPALVQYDLKDHKVIRTIPWPTDTEPGYFSLLKYSPDGKLLYFFSDEILIYDAASLQQVGSWNLSIPGEPGLGRFDLGWVDDTNDDPDYFNALFTMNDPARQRQTLVVGRVHLGQKSLDFFPIGPAPERGQVSFALGGDRAHAYVMLQDIGHHELWTIDMAHRKLQSRVEFRGRPRMALKTSSNGRILYLYQAGNTINLYDADGFKFLRTITTDGDMPYNTFHVVAPAAPPASPAKPPR